MIRTPTPFEDLYRWHTDALRAAKVRIRGPRVIEGEPECGWFTLRCVRGGPLVPVAIRCVQVLDAQGLLSEPERLEAFQVDIPVDPAAIWLSVAGSPISEIAYRGLMDSHRTSARMRAVSLPLEPLAMGARA